LKDDLENEKVRKIKEENRQQWRFSSFSVVPKSMWVLGWKQ